MVLPFLFSNLINFEIFEKIIEIFLKKSELN